ncbi:hypothetical protein J4219_02830 [Candidatus Woesearchaeota archaeon]|nr:hypothetical protein [Candidatus Woesearchaeota archaeon]
MTKRKSGWQVWVDFKKDHVIKTPKSKKEIAKEVRNFVVWKKQPLSEIGRLHQQKRNHKNSRKKFIK